MKKHYNARGVVVGNLWGGGQGGYEAESFREYKNLAKLKKRIKEGVEDGTLDGGMGFESLEGALMEIEKVETITKNGKEYINREVVEYFEAGELTDSERYELPYTIRMED